MALSVALMNLPQPTRPRLTPTFRSWARPGDLSRVASAVAWHVLHPAARGRFVECPPPAAARRLYYEAADGWRAPLFCLDPVPGGAGEPVVIVHGLLGGPDLYRYGADTLARTLREAGFAVYLLTHRGDRHAIAPEGGGSRTAEQIAELDLPAALAAVAGHSGFPRVHLLGNGFGGLLALAVAGRRDAALASVVALAAPLRPPTSSEPSAGSAAWGWVPAGWTVPLRLLGRVGAVLVPEGQAPAGFDLARRCVPSRLRGALMYAADDPSVGLVRTMRGWLDAGGATLYDGAIALRDRIADAEVPLLVVTGTDDPLCSPEAGEAALSAWGHPDRTAIRAPGSHLDLVLGAEAPERVFGPIAEWLVSRRRLAWVTNHLQDGAEAPR